MIESWCVSCSIGVVAITSETSSSDVSLAIHQRVDELRHDYQIITS